MNAAIDDKEARKFWRKVYLAVISEDPTMFERRDHEVAAESADAALDLYAERFGDENLKREIQEFKQERAAKNTPEAGA